MNDERAFPDLPTRPLDPFGIKRYGGIFTTDISSLIMDRGIIEKLTKKLIADGMIDIREFKSTNPDEKKYRIEIRVVDPATWETK